MIYLFLNCDEYLIAQSVADIKAQLGDPEMADLNTTVLQGTQTNGPDILGQASIMPFLTPKRLVMVHGYLSSLDKRAAASKATNSSAHLEAPDFFERLTELPDSCDLVLFEDGLDKRRQIYKGYTISQSAKKSNEATDERKVAGVDGLVKAKQLHLQELKAPDPKNLAGYVGQQAKGRGIAIDGRSIRLLADYVGSNLRQLANELEKLATYA